MPMPNGMRLYDFRMPLRMRTEQMRRMQHMWRRFARLVSTRLSHSAKAAVNLELLLFRDTTMSHFAASFRDPTVIALGADDASGSMFAFDMQSHVAIHFLELLMAGPCAEKATARALTDLEVDLLEPVFEGLTTTLNALVPGGGALKLISVETNVLLARAMTGEESGVEATFEMSHLGVSGKLRVFCSWSFLEKALASGSEANSPAYFGPEKSTIPRRALLGVSVPVWATVASLTLPLAKCRAFSTGTVIPLKKRFPLMVDVAVGGLPKFSGQMEVVGRSLLVKITKVYLGGGDIR